jgi:drug/metabolite transporter (DMT)-like permease
MRFTAGAAAPRLAGMAASLPSSLATSAPSQQRRGDRLMIAGGLLLGTIGVFFIEAGAEPLTAVWFRCCFGAVSLAAWAAATGRLGELRLRGAGAAAALGSGLLVLLNWALFFEAVSRTSIAVATVVFHVQPFWIMAIAAWRLGERITRRQLAASAVALAGLSLATGAVDAWLAGATRDTAYVVGIGLCLAASLSWAVATLIARSTRALTPLGLSFWQCALGSLLALAGPVMHGVPAFGASWLWLVGLGVLHTGLAYVLLYSGMKRLSAGRVALLQFVYPAAAIGVDAAVYGHMLSPIQLVGVALMAAALGAARRG